MQTTSTELDLGFLEGFERLNLIGQYSVSEPQSTYYSFSFLDTPFIIESSEHNGTAIVYFDKRSVEEGKLSVGAETLIVMVKEDLPEALYSMEVLSGVVNYIGIVGVGMTIAKGFDRSSGTLYDINYSGSIEQSQKASINKLGTFEATISDSEDLIAILSVSQTKWWFIYETCALCIPNSTRPSNYCCPITNPKSMVDKIINNTEGTVDIKYTNNKSLEAHIICDRI